MAPITGAVKKGKSRRPKNPVGEGNFALDDRQHTCWQSQRKHTSSGHFPVVEGDLTKTQLTNLMLTSDGKEDT